MRSRAAASLRWGSVAVCFAQSSCWLQQQGIQEACRRGSAALAYVFKCVIMRSFRAHALPGERRSKRLPESVLCPVPLSTPSPPIEAGGIGSRLHRWPVAPESPRELAACSRNEVAHIKHEDLRVMGLAGIMFRTVALTSLLALMGRSHPAQPARGAGCAVRSIGPVHYWPHRPSWPCSHSSATCLACVSDADRPGGTDWRESRSAGLASVRKNRAGQPFLARHMRLSGCGAIPSTLTGTRPAERKSASQLADWRLPASALPPARSPFLPPESGL